MKRFESRGREIALLSMYAEDMEGDGSRILSDDDGEPVSVESFDFSRQLIDGVKSNRQEIDCLIARHLHNWSIERLRSIDRCILRIAVYELIYYKKTPVGVVFDEYIELAKRYGDTDSRAFVNGLLNTIYEEYR